jgi:hypothetical protein
MHRNRKRVIAIEDALYAFMRITKAEKEKMLVVVMLW